jgi:NADP-dependent 3-hydroxy acid dehydrogenase YdfG
MNNFNGKKVWIIGASSGIGRALARKLAHRGATLALSARSEDELQSLAEHIEGQHHVFPVDVSDYDSFAETAQGVKNGLGQIDSAILLAGMYEPGWLRDMEIKKAHKIVDVNLKGAFSFIHIMLPIMKAQGHGQLALTGSVAGYRGLPKGQPYSATKAAIESIAETLRAEEPELDIRLISPGFVKTRLTDKNDFDMPMKLEPEEAAEHIANGLTGSAYEIHFPKLFTYGVKSLKVMPNILYNIVARKMVEKMKEDGRKNDSSDFNDNHQRPNETASQNEYEEQ